MIAKELFGKLMWSETYQLAPSSRGTFYVDYLADAVVLPKGSKERMKAIATAYQYHLNISGCPILPYSFGVLDKGTYNVNRSGRGVIPSEGMIKGSFKQCEKSPYKQHYPYEVSTSIWKVDGEKGYYYGLPAYTQTNGKMGKDCGDLLLIHTADWKTVKVYVFKGLGQPKYLYDAVRYIKEI